jgi:hypothetical protein
MKYSVFVVSYCRNMDSEMGEILGLGDDAVFVIDLVKKLTIK